MKLKKGITGFSYQPNEEPVPTIDTENLKTILDRIEKDGLYKVLDFKKSQPNNNYFRIALIDSTKKRKVDVLLNAQYPYYGGVTPESSWMNLNFTDIPSDIRKYLDEHYEYIQPIVLNQKINKNDLGELSRAEVEQIEYWKSETLGQVIFNGFD